jgi:hypothetical protein
MGFTNSNWASDITYCKSIFKYLLSLGFGPICELSKNQSTIALSFVEAEYKGVVNITIHALWIHNFLVELDVQFQCPTIIWCDNHSILKFCRDLMERK